MNAVFVFSLRLVLIILSYTFLGWIVYTVFADLRRGTSDKQEKVFPPITLSAQINDDSQEKRFRKQEIILGRDPSSDFPLDNETISLRHCKISYHNKQWWAEDLDSTNGTYLNDILITTGTTLTNDDQLRLGKVEISININQNTGLE